MACLLLSLRKRSCRSWHLANRKDRQVAGLHRASPSAALDKSDFCNEKAFFLDKKKASITFLLLIFQDRCLAGVGTLPIEKVGRLPGFIGPVPPPLWIRSEIECQFKIEFILPHCICFVNRQCHTPTCCINGRV